MANSEQSNGRSLPPEEIAKLIDTQFPEARRDLGAFRILKCGGGRLMCSCLLNRALPGRSAQFQARLCSA
jgi:hypothetical protein